MASPGLLPLLDTNVKKRKKYAFTLVSSVIVSSSVGMGDISVTITVVWKRLFNRAQ